MSLITGAFLFKVNARPRLSRAGRGAGWRNYFCNTSVRILLLILKRIDRNKAINSSIDFPAALVRPAGGICGKISGIAAFFQPGSPGFAGRATGWQVFCMLPDGTHPENLTRITFR
jgi:hypothetical protein